MSTTELATANRAAPITLERLGRRWAQDSSRGLGYINGMTTWLSGYSNPHTRRTNAFSVVEFFDWYDAVRAKGRVPMPHEITREDANAYTSWLHSRTSGLEQVRLDRDPLQAHEAAVYAHVRARPGATHASIRAALLAHPSLPKKRTPGGMILGIEEEEAWAVDLLLARMVERKLLCRTPTMADLRARGVVGEVDWSRAGIDFRPDPSVYRYEVAEHTEAVGEDRASTVLRRIATLSSLWRHWAEKGENTDAATVLLKYNIWSPLVRETAELTPSRQKAYRQSHTPTLEHWQALMSTTESRSLDDVRDRAILCLLFWQGLRVQELCALERRHRVVLDGVDCIRVRRKNGKVQHLVLEPEALAALDQLDLKLAELAEAAEQKQRSREDATLEPRWSRVLRSPEAPLLPATRRWGANATDPQERPITRQAVAMMLRRRSAMPIDPNDPDGPTVIPESDWPRIHPHGFRHLAAKEARRAGADVAVIQASLGHESLATTTRYVEEHELRRIRLFSTVDRSSSEAPSTASAPRRRGRAVIDVQSEEIDDRL